MKVNIEKLYDRFNKKWIGRLYGYSIFMIFCSFGGVIGYALRDLSVIYLWLWLLVIGYAIALPIGYIRQYIRKNKVSLKEKIDKDLHLLLNNCLIPIYNREDIQSDIYELIDEVKDY